MKRNSTLAGLTVKLSVVARFRLYQWMISHGLKPVEGPTMSRIFSFALWLSRLCRRISQSERAFPGRNSAKGPEMSSSVAGSRCASRGGFEGGLEHIPSVKTHELMVETPLSRRRSIC